MTIFNWEKGKTKPTAANLRKLEDIIRIQGDPPEEFGGETKILPRKEGYDR